MASCVALIPARAGSKRIPQKNIRPLGGKPLMAWTIAAAKESGVFSDVFVCSDSLEYLAEALKWGVNAYLREPAGDTESDIVWVKQALEYVQMLRYDAFAILRPTSPFRTAATIRRAWEHFLANQPCDSLRAVEPAKQHPGKMWVLRQNRMLPLLPWEMAASPWHSSATQSLPQVYMQTAALEIAWTKTVMEQGTIAGTNVLPFVTEGLESLDLNSLEDWERAEAIIAGGYFMNTCRPSGTLK